MPSWIVHPKTGELVLKEDYYTEKYFQTEHLQMTNGNEKVRLNFISDHMEPTRHMVDGKYYTSKAAFRAATKRAGCIEVGNDTKGLTKERTPIKLDRRKRREDIKKAISDIRNGKVQRGTP